MKQVAVMTAETDRILRVVRIVAFSPVLFLIAHVVPKAQRALINQMSKEGHVHE